MNFLESGVRFRCATTSDTMAVIPDTTTGDGNRIEWEHDTAVIMSFSSDKMLDMNVIPTIIIVGESPHIPYRQNNQFHSVCIYITRTVFHNRFLP